MSPTADESRPGPLDRYHDEYLHAMDAAGDLNRLQQEQCARLAVEFAGDPSLAAKLQTELLRFYDIQTQLKKEARAAVPDPNETAPELDAGAAGNPGMSADEFVGNYRIVAPIGRGGMGVVDLARDRRLDTRVVAIKRLLHHDENYRKRFMEEARAMGMLRHPNIIPIFHIDEHAGQPFFAMEFAEGGSLAGWLRSMGLPDWRTVGAKAPFPTPEEMAQGRKRLLQKDQLRQSVQFVATLARAIDHAHIAGVLHRDLKPDNILLQVQPKQAADLQSPRIADFGLAQIVSSDSPQDRTTSAGLGTVFYSAPEQHRGGMSVDERADIYALGTVLYELLTGASPFRQEISANVHNKEALKAIKQREPTPASKVDARVPLDLSAICQRCLQVVPGDRFQKAIEVAEELERWLRGEPIRSRRATIIERSWSWIRRKPLQTAIIALLVMMVAAGAIAGWQALENAERKAAIAEDQLARERTLRIQKEKTAQAAQEAIDKAAVLRGFGDDLAKLLLAQAAVDEANAVVKAGVTDEPLRQRVQVLVDALHRDIADARLLKALEKARLHKVHLLIRPGRDRSELEWVNDGQFVNQAAEKMYFAAFHEYGLDLEKMKDDEILRAFQARSPRVRGETAAALTELGLLRGGLAVLKKSDPISPLRSPKQRHWVRYFLIAQEIDDDPWRKKLRKTLLETNPFVFGFELGQIHRTAVNLDLPTSSVCLLAELWGAVGQPRAGVEILRKAEPRFPNDPLICCYLAFMQTRLREPAWSEIAHWYRTAVALQPDSAVLRVSLAHAYFKQEKHDEALASFTAVTRLDPKNALAWFYQGVIRNERKQSELAVDAWRRAIQAEPAFPEAMLNLALMLSFAGQQEEARSLYEGSLKLAPENPSAHYNFGNLLLELNEPKRAIEHFQRAIAIKEDFGEAYCDLGRGLQTIGRFDEAYEHFKRGRDLLAASSSPEAERANQSLKYYARFKEFNQRRTQLIAGETPSSSDDCLAAAHVTALGGEYAASVRLYQAAFKLGKPSFENRHYWQAACAAARGGGADGADKTISAQLRGQAFEWLKAERELAKKLIEEDDANTIRVVNRYRAWLRDPLLAGVRDPQMLERLEAAERKSWSQFWSEIRNFPECTN